MKIQVPTSINDVTLREFQKFSEINNAEQDLDFVLFKTISIFCDVPMDVVAKFPQAEAERIVDDIRVVLEQTPKFQRRIMYNGVEYGFIPDLTAMTIGEYVDLEQGLADPKSYHKAAAVMYRPIRRSHKEVYTIDAYDAMDAEMYKDMPFGIIQAGIVFFYNIANELLMVSPSYLRNKTKEISTILERANLQKSTDGSIRSTTSVEAVRQIIKAQLA